MLTHEIVRYSPPQRVNKEGKPTFINGSEEHRRYIFQKVLEFVSRDVLFGVGNHYRIKGRSSDAQLIDICTDYKGVKWKGMKPLFMECYLPNEQDCDLFHPSDLLKRRN